MKSKTSSLLLKRSEVEGIISMRDAIEAVRNVFMEHHHGRTKMPHRIHIQFPQYNGTIGYMEAAVDSLGVSACKVVGGPYIDNPKNGLPLILAIIVLNRIDNGLPIAIMDGTYITMLRTGAVAAIAADHLSRRDSKCVGIIGAGVQGRGQLQGLIEVRNIKTVLVYDVSKLASEVFTKEMGKKYGLDIKIAESPRDFKACDIIASATPSKIPIISKELLHDGLHINSVGMGAGLGKREVDFSILRLLKVVVDDLEVAKRDALREAYECQLISDGDIYATLGELLSGGKPGREGNEVTIFISSGVAIQDAAVAQVVYAKAVAEGIGEYINFFL
jgi:alanine dehydrogenase